MIDSDQNLIVAIVKGEDRASTSRVAKALKIDRPRIANPEEILDHTAFPCGGTPSFGFSAIFLVDPKVLDKKLVYTGGGSDTSLVRVSSATLLKLNQGKVEFNIKNELVPFVNCIWTGESASAKSHTNIPLYADGYPGIMFQQATNGFYLLPKKKKLSQLFLYGQTLEPISLDVEGTYQFIVLQLYPFASKYLLGVDPKELNDDCFDLLEINTIDVDSYKHKLLKSDNSKDQVEIILDLTTQLVKSNRIPENDRIQRAISKILKHRGQVKVKELTEQLFITERTLERDFMSQVGLTPKQFAKIIQFQCSLNQLTQKKINKLTEVGLDSGFADQSHFIRAFKKYTGQTPSYYLRQLSST